MLVGIVIVAVFLSSIVTGQTRDFGNECNTRAELNLFKNKLNTSRTLKTLENLEVRLQTQEMLMDQQTSKLQHQEALLKNQTIQLQRQEMLLENQIIQLQRQEILLENQTIQLQRQEILLENQTVQLEQQRAQLDQAEDRIRELEAENATIEQLKADCGVLYAKGTTESGVYVISPDVRSPFSVYCDMTDGGWTVIQRRIDGAVNFTRTWDEYVNGFGDMNGEYWLSLEKIHRLTKDGAEIYFDIGNYDGTREYAQYTNFTVHNTTTLYKMNVDAFGYNGSIAEIFSYHDVMKFTTYDRRNDDSCCNCALSLGGGGWWFNNCYRLGNFNGVFGKKDITGIRYSNGDIVTYVDLVITPSSD